MYSTVSLKSTSFTGFKVDRKTKGRSSTSYSRKYGSLCCIWKPLRPNRYIIHHHGIGAREIAWGHAHPCMRSSRVFLLCLHSRLCFFIIIIHIQQWIWGGTQLKTGVLFYRNRRRNHRKSEITCLTMLHQAASKFKFNYWYFDLLCPIQN